MTTYTVKYLTTEDSTRSPYEMADLYPASHRSLSAARATAARANAANAMRAEIYDAQGSLVLRVAQDGSYRAP